MVISSADFKEVSHCRFSFVGKRNKMLSRAWFKKEGQYHC